MNLFRITGTSFNNLKQLVVKVIGAVTTYTAEEYSPFGTDSRPPNGMTAIYARTQANGDECIIGYLHKDRLAQIGEHRIFSTDDQNVLKTYIWLHNDGTMDIGGNTKHMVRFEELQIAFNQLKTDFNNLVTAYNSHIHPVGNAVPAAPGPVVTTPTITSGTPSTADITPAKINEIKTL